MASYNNFADFNFTAWLLTKPESGDEALMLPRLPASDYLFCLSLSAFLADSERRAVNDVVERLCLFNWSYVDELTSTFAFAEHYHTVD